jgi:hypothetical protein
MAGAKNAPKMIAIATAPRTLIATIVGHLLPPLSDFVEVCPFCIERSDEAAGDAVPSSASSDPSYRVVSSDRERSGSASCELFDLFGLFALPSSGEEGWPDILGMLSGSHPGHRGFRYQSR